ncbi:hypothetical protein B6C97_11390 [Gilliamella apis]|nr:hypothetical protein B6C97_11390 [Gilliamella apis]
MANKLRDYGVYK